MSDLDDDTLRYTADPEAQVAELTRERDAQQAEWSKAYDIGVTAKHQLTAAQARIVELRGVLNLSCKPVMENSAGQTRLAEFNVALLAFDNTDALDRALAAERERLINAILEKAARPQELCWIRSMK